MKQPILHEKPGKRGRWDLPGQCCRWFIWEWNDSCWLSLVTLAVKGSATPVPLTCFNCSCHASLFWRFPLSQERPDASCRQQQTAVVILPLGCRTYFQHSPGMFLQFSHHVTSVVGCFCGWQQSSNDNGACKNTVSQVLFYYIMRAFDNGACGKHTARPWA